MAEQEQSQDTINEEMEEATTEPEVAEEEQAAAEEAESVDPAEYDALNKRYLRLLADFDNYKRRTASEKEALSKFANENLVKELLPVLDSFELALKNAPTAADDSVSAYHEGFAKVQRQLLDTLSKAGLARIEALGQVYDPNVHEAIMVVDDDSQPANTVIDELRAGYTFKDKVIRPTVCRVTGNN